MKKAIKIVMIKALIFASSAHAITGVIPIKKEMKSIANYVEHEGRAFPIKWETASGLVSSGNAVFVDIRHDMLREKGYIIGSFSKSENLNSLRNYVSYVKFLKKIPIFVCTTGTSASALTNYLDIAFPNRDIYYLKDGMNGCRKNESCAKYIVKEK